MASPDGYVPLVGSERAPLPGTREAGKVPPDHPLEVTLRLRSRSPKKDFLDIERGSVLLQRKKLAREEFAKTYGADPRDIEKIKTFAHEHRLKVTDVDLARRTVVLAGTSASLGTAFHVDRKRYESPSGSYCGHCDCVCIPTRLAGTIEGVFGLDERPQAMRCHHSRRLELQMATPPRQASYTGAQLANVYHFPAGLDGQGQCIALIELGGGYRHQDLAAFFKQLHLPMPKISCVAVNGAENSPSGDTESYDGEVVGDIEVLGAIAPGASIVVYFAPCNDRGFLDALTMAIHDRRRQPSIVSISWGDSEYTWAPRTRRLVDEVLQEAVVLGVTVLCSSGDYGSSNGVSGGVEHVNFPASSPYVLACGGTTIECSGNRIIKETVWNDGKQASGGGVSEFFPLPDWQESARVPESPNQGRFKGRGVPDVAGYAAAYQILINGKSGVVPGGTSAVAPLWAGLIARMNQKLGYAVGFLNPFLYREYHRLSELGALHQIAEGNNGAYTAGKGWNPCTGLGTPDGSKLASALAADKAVKAAKAGMR